MKLIQNINIREKYTSYRLFKYELLFEIQLSRKEGWDPIHRFKPTTLVFLSQTGTWNVNAICCVQ